MLTSSGKVTARQVVAGTMVDLKVDEVREVVRERRSQANGRFVATTRYD